MNWTHFLRQLFLCSGPWTLYFIQGLYTGLMTVLLPQLREQNQDISIELFSWLTSIFTYGGIPSTILLSSLNNSIGRKKPHTIICISTLIGFTIFYFSTNIHHFFIGTIILGPLSSCHTTTNKVILTEFTSPNNRGLFLTLQSANFFWGILVANAMGTFFHWQNIVILGFVCTLYSIINVIIWPESPLWLATKGKFQECSEAHRWLKGSGEESEKELKKLLELYKKKNVNKRQWRVRNLLATVCRIQFLKPILLLVLLSCIHCFSGKMVCTVFAIDILKKISSSESAAYSGMLIIDSVTVVSMYLASVLSKFLKRRHMLLGFSSTSVTIMICISLYLYLAKLGVIFENKYISISFFAAYSILVCFGPLIMCPTINAELLPLKSRILALCISAILFKLITGTFFKIFPFCFKILGMHGTFMLFAILSAVCLVLAYLYVPETKNKTIQEISDCLKPTHIKNTRQDSEHNKLNNNQSINL